MKNVEKRFIPYGQQWLEEDDIQAVVEVLKSDYLTTGPKIDEFEKDLAEYVGAKYAVAISNGTAALHAACFAAGIGEGDEVITSPITFAASANCALYVGARPVFADIDPETYNIDPQDIRRKITDKTKAIIPVHYTGQPCDMDSIIKIAEEYGLIIIGDGAHALGAKYKERKIGSIGDMTTFSFHPVKHITTGEGGAIATNNKEFYERMIIFRTHGITRDKNRLHGNEGAWFYEQQYLGNNYRMTDIQAALGISQLKKIDKFLRLRRKYVEIYNEAFSGIKEIATPYQNQDTDSAWHLYVVRLRLDRLKASRREVFEELIRRGIGVNVHYIPVYYHPYYRSLGYGKGLCPNAEKLYEEIVTLPLYPKMTEEDVRYVIDHVKDTINIFKKQT